MNVTPLLDRVLIRRQKKEERTPSGLFIPDAAKVKPQRGMVVRVGSGPVLPDGRERPLKVREGDQVVFARSAGDDVVLDDVDYVIVRERDLLAIVAD